MAVEGGSLPTPLPLCLPLRLPSKNFTFPENPLRLPFFNHFSFFELMASVRLMRKHRILQRKGRQKRQKKKY